MRKQRGRDNAAKEKAASTSYNARKKRKQGLKRDAFQVALKDVEKEDWNYLKSYGYTAGKIFLEGIKSCMNQLATKRVDESLYGEYEAYLMFTRQKTNHGYRLEPRVFKSKLAPQAVNYNRVSIISLSPCPRGDNMVVVKYYKIGQRNEIIRTKIYTVRKKVNRIDEKILLFFSNGGNHT